MRGLHAASSQRPAGGGLGLPLLMLGIAGLGVVAGTVRAVLLGGPGGWGWLLYAVWLLLPVAVVAAFCLWLSRASPGAALGGGLAAALVAAAFNFEALHPKYNEDANIGLGIYLILGWAFPLGPAVLLGGLIGALVERRRGKPPSPAALEDARPLPPLWPWLLPPLLAALVSAYIQAVWHEDDPASASRVALYFLILLPLTVGMPLLARGLTRGREGRGGFPGFCVGWAVSLLLWNGEGFFFPSGMCFWTIVVLCLLFPTLGYAAGAVLSPKR
ncbi:hypothetical protein [Deinococcus geothermalis]|uniref:hypothetical protein n=1 Tax=Deinococcus geothermalis TaxID=68909 RepID=UPI002356B4A3|nr:hypothetical protein [Deinococcus geothermalis]